MTHNRQSTFPVSAKVETSIGDLASPEEHPGGLLQIPPDRQPMTTMTTVSYVLGAQPPRAGLCLDSLFTLRTASKSDRYSVVSILHQPECSRDATPSAETFAPRSIHGRFKSHR